MKIIHLILGKARQERMNGVSKVAHMLASSQKELGHEACLWGITPDPIALLPKRVYPFRFFQAKRLPFAIDSSLKQALSRLDPKESLIHMHGGFIPPFYTIGKLLQKRGIRYVYSPHGALSPVALQQGKTKKRLYFQFLEKKLIEHAHCVHFLGKSQFDAFDDVYKIKHKRIIPNGQNLTELRHKSSEIDRPENDPVFSFCGRLRSYYKGLDILIEGFELYHKNEGKGKLWLIGDGEDREKLEKAVKQKGLSDHVVFWGAQYGEKKYQLINQSDMFVHPSRSEGFPTAILEAAGLGKACLVSTATNAGEYIDQYNAGIHLIDNNPQQLQEAFHSAQQMYHDGLLSRLGDNARKMIESRFNWQHLADQMVQVYQQPQIQ